MMQEAKDDIDALLRALRKAEQYKRWGLFEEILRYIHDAGARLIYFSREQYGIALPPLPLTVAEEDQMETLTAP